jgi:large subunit ribosomal protein L18
MKSLSQKKTETRTRRRARIRARVKGTAARPRLAVFRSAKHIYAQLIDDTTGKTIVASTDAKSKKGAKAEGMEAKIASAHAVGQDLAEKAKKAGVTAVVFDRGGYSYHGRIQALADGARAGGLQF